MGLVTIKVYTIAILIMGLYLKNLYCSQQPANMDRLSLQEQELTTLHKDFKIDHGSNKFVTGSSKIDKVPHNSKIDHRSIQIQT